MTTMDPVKAWKLQQERLGVANREKSLDELRALHARWAASFDMADSDHDGLLTKPETQKAFQRILGRESKMPTRKWLETFEAFDKAGENTGKVDFRIFVKITIKVSEFMTEHPKWDQEEEEEAEREEKKKQQEAKERRNSEANDVFAILGIKKNKDMAEIEARKEEALKNSKEAARARLKAAGQAVLKKTMVVRRAGALGALAKRGATIAEPEEDPTSPSSKLRKNWERFGQVADGTEPTSRRLARRHTIDLPSDLPQMKVGGMGASCFSLKFSPDGSLLAGAFFDGGLRIYDVDKSELKHCLNLPKSKGGTLATAEEKAGDREEGGTPDNSYNPLAKMRDSAGGGGLTNLRWRPGGRRPPIVATTDTTGTLSLWEIPKGRGNLAPRCLVEQKGDYGLNAMSFSEDGCKVVVAGTEKVLHVYDLEEGIGRVGLKKGECNGKPLAVLGQGVPPPSKVGGHMLKVMSVCAHRTNPNVYVSCSLDKTTLVWDLRTGAFPVTSFFGPALSGDAMEISKDSNFLLTGSHRSERPLELFDLRMLPGFQDGSRPTSSGGGAGPSSRPGTPTGSGGALRAASMGALPGVRPSSRGPGGASGSSAGGGKGGGVIASYEWAGNEAALGSNVRPTSCLLFSSGWDLQDNKTIVACGEKENLARIYEVKEQNEPLRVIATLWGKDHAFWSSAISADGNNAAFGSADGAVVIVDIRGR